TRISKGKLQLQLTTADAHETLQHALAMCQSEIMSKSSRLELRMEAARYHVRADAPRLQQVFWNLILNAVKFTPAGGQIIIRTLNREERFLVEVSDTGVGITPDVLPRIFDAFQQGEESVTRQFGGLGLGLTVAKALVDAHGGHIEAKSAGPGRGATFTIELDTVETPVPTLSANEVKDTRPAAGKIGARVLLAEDHHDTREAMSRLLTRWGYRVEAAETVAEALQKAREMEFDILVSDLGLPDGTGLELLQQLQAIRPLPGIAISGFGMEEDVCRSREAGFVEHLIKPVAAQKLRAAMEAVLANRSTPAAPDDVL
ncbi:MAG TPA: ATP-binding protein, partial [Chthoniobacteraceae bacterium]